MLVQNEADVYYRILDRTKELDLEESTLNGISLSGYSVKYEKSTSVSLLSGYDNGEQVYITNQDRSYNEVERMIKDRYKNNELYVTELDNHRRKLSFKTPTRSDGNFPTNIKLDLKVTERKFYFAIARDNEIDTVKIDGILFHPDDQDEDGLYKKRKKRDNNGNVILDGDGNPIYHDDDDKDYGFVAGATLEIEVRFKNETMALRKELIPNYLSDCLGNVPTNMSNNYIQIISPFYMPRRDVLLFLKTEQTYLLKIFKANDSKNIESIDHEGELELPITKKHFWDDLVVIYVMFSNQYFEIDREYLKSQLSDIEDIRFNDSERSYEQNFGYDISIPQTIKFFMPARDVTLYIKEKDYRHKLTIRSFNRKTDDNDESNDEEPNHFSGININNEPPDGVLNESNELIYYFHAIDKVMIKVYFDGPENEYFELDKEFMTTQLMAFEKINGNQDFVGKRDKTDLVFTGAFQEINFVMPDQDLVLVIKESTIRRFLTIEPDPYQNISATKNIQRVIYENKLYPATMDKILVSEKLTTIVEGQEINLFVEFEDIKMKIDEDHFYGQIIPRQIYEAGEEIEDALVPILSATNKELYQRIRFAMPTTDFTLYLRWAERVYFFDVDYPFALINNPVYSIVRDGATIDNIFNGILYLYTGDELTITLNYVDSYELNRATSKCKVGNEFVSLDDDTYFKFTDDNNTITITCTMKKKNIDISLRFKFKGIGKFVCSQPSFNLNHDTSIAEERPGTIVAWGGGERGFTYIDTVLIKPGRIHLMAGEGARGGWGGNGSDDDGQGGRTGGSWSSITYTNGVNKRQQTIILGEGGNGGANDGKTPGIGAGRPAASNGTPGNLLKGGRGYEGGQPGELEVSGGSPSDFVIIDDTNNKLGSNFSFTPAGGGGGHNRSQDPGGGGAPSCGGGGGGGEGLRTSDGGGEGSILNKSILDDGTGRFHFPLYEKAGSQAINIIKTLNEWNPRWGLSSPLGDDIKDQLLVWHAGIYLFIEEDPI
jgi:hypothetical protein